MRTHAASDIPCALARSLPNVYESPRANLAPLAYAKKDHMAAVTNDGYKIRARITHIDRAIIRYYFHRRDCILSLGRSSKKTLSAVWRRESLPEELERRLSILPTGYQRILAGGDVLLIETASRAIVDVMRGIYATI